MNATRPTGDFAQIAIADLRLIANRLPRADTAVVAVYAYVVWLHDRGDEVRRDDIAQHLNVITPDRVDYALRKLVDLGLITRDAHGIRPTREMP